MFVVGGGGRLSGYTVALAQKLGIQKERVAVRGKEVMQNVVFPKCVKEPDSLLVTPIGIALAFTVTRAIILYLSHLIACKTIRYRESCCDRCGSSGRIPEYRSVSGGSAAKSSNIL